MSKYAGVFVWELVNGKLSPAKIDIEIWDLPKGRDGVNTRKERVVWFKPISEALFELSLDELAEIYPYSKSVE